MLGLTGLNPYAWIAGAVVIAGIGGGFAYQSHMIHHYHTQYLEDEKTVAILQHDMASQEAADKQQIAETQKTIMEIASLPPEIKTVTKTINDAPEPADCKTPPLPQDIKDRF